MSDENVIFMDFFAVKVDEVTSTQESIKRYLTKGQSRNLMKGANPGSDEGPMLEMLNYTIRIGSTPTFLYFDLYLYSAYAAHFVYFIYTDS